MFLYGFPSVLETDPAYSGANRAIEIEPINGYMNEITAARHQELLFASETGPTQYPGLPGIGYGLDYATWSIPDQMFALRPATQELPPHVGG